MERSHLEIQLEAHHKYLKSFCSELPNLVLLSTICLKYIEDLNERIEKTIKTPSNYKSKDFNSSILDLALESGTMKNIIEEVKGEEDDQL